LWAIAAGVASQQVQPLAGADRGILVEGVVDESIQDGLAGPAGWLVDQHTDPAMSEVHQLRRLGQVAEDQGVGL
jgi:hypothetical protein